MNMPRMLQSLMGGHTAREQTCVNPTVLGEHKTGAPFCSDMYRNESCVNMNTNYETIGYKQQAIARIKAEEFIVAHVRCLLPVDASSVALLIQPSFSKSHPPPPDKNPMEWKKNIETRVVEVKKAMVQHDQCDLPFEIVTTHTVSTCTYSGCSTATVVKNQTVHNAALLHEFQERVCLIGRKKRPCIGVLGEKMGKKKTMQRYKKNESGRLSIHVVLSFCIETFLDGGDSRFTRFSIGSIRGYMYHLVLLVVYLYLYCSFSWFAAAALSVQKFLLSAYTRGKFKFFMMFELKSNFSRQ